LDRLQVYDGSAVRTDDQGTSKSPSPTIHFRSLTVLLQVSLYTCKSHLKDKGFCTPVIDEAEAAAKKKKEEMDKEIELIKKEYEAKMKKQKKKEKKSKDKKEDENKDAEEKKAKEEKDEKVMSHVDSPVSFPMWHADQGSRLQIKEAEEKGAGSGAAEDDLPRVYALHRTFHQKAISMLRQQQQKRVDAENSSRNRQRLADPTGFPMVPSGNP